MNKFILSLASVFAAVFMMCPAMMHAQNNDAQYTVRSLLNSNVEQIRSQLPIELEPGALSITEMTLDDSNLVMVMTANPSVMNASFEELKRDLDSSAEDVVKQLSSMLPEMLVSEDMGIKMVLVNGEAQGEYYEHTVTCSDLASIFGISKSSLNIYDRILTMSLNELQASMPLVVQENYLAITAMNVQGGMLNIDVEVAAGAGDKPAIDAESLNSDAVLAEIFATQGEFIDLVCRAGYGLHMKVSNKTNAQNFFSISVSLDRLKKIHGMIGSVKQPTAMEMFAGEINAMTLPAPAGDGLVATEAYIKGSEVFYVYKFENQVSFTDESIKAVKQDIINSLLASEVTKTDDRRVEFVEKNIVVHYVYYNADGALLMDITIKPSDLFTW